MKNSAMAIFVATAVAMCGLRAEDYEVTVGTSDTDVVWSDVTDSGPAALLAGGTKDRTLVKKGGGRLVIACDLKGSGYTGQIRVREGFLQLRHDGACGTYAGGVVVEEGATLEGDSTYKSGGLAYSWEPLTFGGFGVNGTEGALKMIGNGTWNFFEQGTKTMTSDTLLNGAGRLDVRFGTLNMGGYTLYASNFVPIVGVNITSPGKIVCCGDGSGSFTLEAGTKFNGGPGYELLFAGQTKFTMKEYTGEATWTMALSNTVTITPGTSANESINNLDTALLRNRWDGPVYIGKSRALYISGTESHPTKHLVNINGKVSGQGGLAIIYPRGYLRLKYPDNDFTGNVTVQGTALLEAACLGSLGKGTLTINSGGTVKFLYSGMGDFTMTDAELERMMAKKRSRWSDNATKTLWTGYKSQTADYFWTDPIYQFEGVPDFTYAKDFTDGNVIYHEETNTLTLTGMITNRPDIVNTCGTLVLAHAGDNWPGNIFVRDGTVKIGPNSNFILGSKIWRLNGRYPATPRLVIGENAMFANIDTQSYALPRNYAGGTLGNAEGFDCLRGIFELEPGSVATNVVYIGGCESSADCATNNMGAAYLRGRLVVVGDNSRDKANVGKNANGYMEIDAGGCLDSSTKSIWIGVGGRGSGTDTPGYGVLHVKGGSLIHRSVGFSVNDGGGYGHLRVSSGIVSNTTLIVGKSLYSNYSGGEGVVTIDGGDVSVSGTAQLGGISNSVSIVNINGGEFRPAAIQVITDLPQTHGGSQAPHCSFLNANNPSYVNFNGGTYKPMLGTQQIAWMTPDVTRYTVFAGGACIDVGEYSRTLTAQLKAPAGKGVQSVAFSCSEPWRYIGAPYVRIVDPAGTGFGATAAADFDSSSGVVTGVTVTSPGCSYGEGTYAEISFGGWTNMVRAAVTLTDNDTSGGFMKKGSATLYIASTNEWHGITKVAEGTLRLQAQDCLPCTSGVAVEDGATFDMGSYSVPAGTLSGTGNLVGDFTLSGTLTVDAADLLAKRYLNITGSLTILPGTKIVVTHPESIEGNTHGFCVITASNGISGTIEIDRNSVPDARRTVFQSANGIRLSGLRGVFMTFR